MNEAGLIKLKSIVQDLIHREIKSKSNKDRSIAFYIGLIESISSQESLLHKVILDDAKKLTKDVENETTMLNDSAAISALLAMHLLKSNNHKVSRKISAYLNNRLSDFEYSPLKNAMTLFLLCQCIDYLDSSIKDAISNKLTDLMATSHLFENLCLIYASSLTLNKDNKKRIWEKSAEKVMQYKSKEMTLSQGIYALWFYEIFINPHINSYEHTFKLQIVKWSNELKKEIMPQLFKELSSKPIEAQADEILPTETFSVSAFELSLIYETILKNEDRFLIISQQDFTNSLIEKCKEIFLNKVKWQSYFWSIVLIALFTLPWYLLNRFSPQVLITAMIGILLTVITFSLRYKHIKCLLLEKREWITKNHKSLICSLLFGIFFAYIASFADVKKLFQLKLTKPINAFMIAFVSIVGILLPNLVSPLKDILNDLLFSIKLPSKLEGGGNHEIK